MTLWCQIVTIATHVIVQILKRSHYFLRSGMVMI